MNDVLEKRVSKGAKTDSKANCDECNYGQVCNFTFTYLGFVFYLFKI